uniref:CitMHS domain-containing protein n=1 Tax=Panagrellus redivivus TaxID=6233 RepID=A0A7E4W612_PANRE
MSFFWVTEVVPLAVTALIPLVLYPLLGVAKATDVANTYFSDSNFVFFGSMVMAAAVEAGRLHERIALRILNITGSNPRWLMLGFMCATNLLSLWISNTGTTAMMVPIMLAVIRELENCRKFDDPEAHLKHIEPQHVTDEIDIDSIPSDIRRVYKGLLLSICFTASIGGTGTLIGTGSNVILSGFLEEKYGSNNPVTFSSWILFAFPQMIAMFIVCWIWLQICFIGLRKRDMSGEDTISRTLKKKYEQLGPIRYEERSILVVFVALIILWLFRHPKFIPGWGDLFRDEYVSDGTVAITASVLLFILPADNPIKTKPKEGQYRTIMTWAIMKEKFAWSTLLLLGGGYGMAYGVESSGLSHLISQKLSGIDNLPDWLFVCIACVLVTSLSEFSSNVATASIFVPMVQSIAVEKNVNPLKYMLPVTLSTSFAFMFPAGVPPNAIVFGTHMLSVLDMFLGGCMLNICALIFTQLTMMTVANAVFDLNTLPEWAIPANTTAIPHA